MLPLKELFCLFARFLPAWAALHTPKSLLGLFKVPRDAETMRRGCTAEGADGARCGAVYEGRRWCVWSGDARAIRVVGDARAMRDARGVVVGESVM